MDLLLLPLAVLATLALLSAVLLAAFLLRRVVLSRGVGTFDCSLRNDDARRSGAWVIGVARYEHDRLDWFRVFGLSPRPARSLARSRLVILDQRAPEGPETYSFLPGWVVVRCAYGTMTLELAMSEPAHNGLAAWLESAPPGQHVHVA